MTTTPFGFMLTKSYLLHDETESEVEIITMELRIRVAYALAKMGIAVSITDVRVRYVTDSGQRRLVASCDYDAPSPETRLLLINAFDDGQRAGHEYQHIRDRGHPSQIKLLHSIRESPYGVGGEDYDESDPELARVLDVAWLRGFFVGCAYERNPGTGPYRLPY